MVYLEDAQLLEALKTVAFEDICITSAVALHMGTAPADAFVMADVPGVAVVFEKADGTKCERCWKILPDVGSHSHAAVCQRCDNALG